MDINKNFGANLRALRAIHELSRKDLAKRLKVSDMAIRDWEKGTHTPRVESVQKVAAYFGVTFLTLCDYNILNRTLE